MAFQMGVAGLFGFSRMLGHIEQKNWTEAAREALSSKWASQTPSRAEEVAGMIRGSS
jgi:lysozyme